MASSILGNTPNNNNINIMQAVNQMKSSGSPQMLFNQMYNSNPSFRSFADSLRGKTPEQAFRENGLDFQTVSRLFR